MSEPIVSSQQYDLAVCAVILASGLAYAVHCIHRAYLAWRNTRKLVAGKIGRDAYRDAGARSLTPWDVQ